MKFISLAVIFVGVVSLLKNLGVQVSWEIIWPIALIFVGVAIKHCGHYAKYMGMMKGMKGGMGQMGECGEGKCKGSDCGNCKK